MFRLKLMEHVLKNTKKTIEKPYEISEFLLSQENFDLKVINGKKK